MLCGAKTRAGTTCMQPTGWGTDHVGEGRCKFHGGLSTGPKDQTGNKNALKHGLHERLYFDSMTEEERGLASSIEPDPLEGALTTYILLSIREKRMLKRIADLEEQEFVVAEKTLSKGWNVKGAVDLLVTTQKPARDEIAAIEDALNTLAGRKAKILEQLDRFKRPDAERALDGLFAAIDSRLNREPEQET